MLYLIPHISEGCEMPVGKMQESIPMEASFLITSNLVFLKTISNWNPQGER